MKHTVEYKNYYKTYQKIRKLEIKFHSLGDQHQVHPYWVLVGGTTGVIKQDIQEHQGVIYKKNFPNSYEQGPDDQNALHVRPLGVQQAQEPRTTQG